MLFLPNALYSARQPSYAWVHMLLIAAAMQEELELAMILCRDQEKITDHGVCYWQACRKENTVLFFKTGVGPQRSAANLDRLLSLIAPSRILLIGYAGALNPSLKLGDLVGVKRTLACSLDKANPALSHLKVDGRFELNDADEIANSAISSGLRASTGDALTSAYVLGEPAHKRLLYEKHHAAIVDMETAAIAGIAAAKQIPFSCARAISDEAEDSFLAPFSYNPSVNLASRTVKIIGAGIQSYQEWKNHAKIAGETLNRFLSSYL
jgi:nucleoside phosphorylase